MDNEKRVRYFWMICDKEQAFFRVQLEPPPDHQRKHLHVLGILDVLYKFELKGDIADIYIDLTNVSGRENTPREIRITGATILFFFIGKVSKESFNEVLSMILHGKHFSCVETMF